MAILTFRSKGLQRLFEDDDRRAIPPVSAGKLGDILAALDNAQALFELRLSPGQCVDVDLVDYH